MFPGTTTSATFAFTLVATSPSATFAFTLVATSPSATFAFTLVATSPSAVLATRSAALFSNTLRVLFFVAAGAATLLSRVVSFSAIPDTGFGGPTETAFCRAVCSVLILFCILTISFEVACISLATFFSTALPAGNAAIFLAAWSYTDCVFSIFFVRCVITALY